MKKKKKEDKDKEAKKKDITNDRYESNAEKKLEDAALKSREFAENRTKEILKLVRLIPLGLKEHFADIWNMMDVIIFSLAMYIVPLWIYIMVKHVDNFKNTAA